MSSPSRLVISFLTAAVALAACNSSNTIVAVTINSPGMTDPNAPPAVLGLKITKLTATFSPHSGATAFVDPDFPPTSDMDGGIVGSFFHRSSLPGGMGGPNDLVVIARDASNAILATGSVTFNVVDGQATATSVTLAVGAGPATDAAANDGASSDGGGDAGGDAGDGGPG